MPKVKLPTFGLPLLDRYLIRLVMWPLAACLGVTVVTLLLERTLRLLDLLSQSNDRFGFVVALGGNLVPHYIGLALPIAFFVALFVVVTRLNTDSEVDSLLASGVSLTRLATPFVILGVGLTLFSLVVFGYIQPYSRYAYRAVMHSALNAGWNGRLPAGAFIDQDNVLITADVADPAGQKLERVFIRRRDDAGREEIVTARVGRIQPEFGGKEVIVTLTDGRRIGQDARGAYQILSFNDWTLRAPLTGAAKLLRARGGDERELTLDELWRQAASGKSILPEQTLLAELYSRLARAFFLPFLPLMAFPLGLAAKRARRAPGLIVAGLILFAFQHSLQTGAGLAESGRASALVGTGTPFLFFCAFCVWMFLGSRDRPGETPISKIAEHIAVFITTCEKAVQSKKKPA